MMRASLILLVNVALARRALVDPLEKVVTLLTDLRTSTNAEQEAEAATYDKFACFCKDTIAEKNAEIAEGETSKTDLQAHINQASEDRDAADAGVADNTKSIGELEAEIGTLKRDRHTAARDYEKSEVDLTGAIHALEAAIRTLKASKNAVGFVDLKPVVDTARRALSLPAGVSLAQVVESVQKDPAAVYDFRSDDVISTLKGLETDFKARKEALDTAETEARNTFESLVQEKDAAINEHQDAIDQHKRDKATATEQLTTASSDLTSVSARLLDNQKYLTGLAQKCSAKAALWDQRTQTRANELQALTQAIELMKAAPEGDDEAEDDQQASFAQFARRARRSSLRAQPKAQLSAVETTVVSRAIALLRSKAMELKSGQLRILASQVKKDPLAKVKTMIQELIERLLKEAEEEANHKGWCDKELALATQQRDYMVKSVKELNTKLTLSEARMEKVSADLVKLDAELAELAKTLEEATALREKEKEENAATIEEAQSGKETVASAIDILDKFYKEAAKATEPSFFQIKDPDGAPDAGFDSAYTGAQGASTGIIGMLQVIQSDYERTETLTQQAEKASAADFLELSTKTESSQAAKGEAKKATDKSLAETTAEDTANREALKTDQGRMNNAISELLSLHEACFDKGETAEERKQKREEELASLRQALCILDPREAMGAHGC